MKFELDESMLEDINGGTVVISKDAMVIGFTTMKEGYQLKNCTFREARDLRDDLLDENPNLSNAQFDALCKQVFQSKGWI